MEKKSSSSSAYEASLNATKNRLNAISSSFCLAKWLQTTLHLHRGLTHSCHNPAAHEVPLAELEKNPAALHNTKTKMQARQEMLTGIRPTECTYCWNIEDLQKSGFSDRILKSETTWAAPLFDKVLRDPMNDRMAPSYLEVSFSNVCNFRCSYCTPLFSSRWAQEIRQGGPYATRINEQGPEEIKESYPESDNPYIRAFWEWWPQLKNSLDTFRITGGEPLLSPTTFKVVQSFARDPAPNLALGINSNLGIPRARLEELVFPIRDLIKEKKIRKFEFFTSIDAWGERAEYIRNGLDTDLFWSNVEFILENLPTVQLHTMVTFNALSVTSFRTFLQHMLTLREKYRNEYSPMRAFVDISYLQNPALLAVNILSKKYQDMTLEILDFMDANQSSNTQKDWGFSSEEIIDMTNLCDWMKVSPAPEKILKERANFYRFFSEHDKRRGTEFLGVFPEMADFWELCREAGDKV